MSQVVSRIWEPVRRKGAERYLQLTILSFAASVSLTRLILELTGYPQLGNGSLHIAHVLYGGVLLFVSSILPLIYANRWAYTWGAILSGVGVGLFIDEIGKFITQNNDYFFPAAAPIIYAFFLITVLIYIQFKKEPKLDARGELYAVLETIEEVLDHSLEKEEYDDMKHRLERIRQKTSQPNLLRLTNELWDFVNSGAIQTVREKPNFFEKVINLMNKYETKYLTEGRVRVFLITSLTILGIPSAYRFISFLTITGNPIERAFFLSKMITELPTVSDYTMLWATIHIMIDGMVGLVLGVSAIMLFINRARLGIDLGSIGLLVSLVAVNLVQFYINQFSTIIIAAYQYIVLQSLYFYDRKYARKQRKHMLSSM